MDRRKLILGGACLIAAPAIVRYEWLMPVKKVFDPGWVRWEPWYNEDMDETLIRLIRDQVPEMIARDICGVQPMTGPTDILFDPVWPYFEPPFNCSPVGYKWIEDHS